MSRLFRLGKRHTYLPPELWALCLAPWGCGTERVELRAGESPVTSDDVGSAGTTDASPSAESTPPPLAGSGMFSGFEPPAAAAPEAGCRKVDFLFVVDNSLSMLDEQNALARSFPEFIEVVQRTIEVADFHIMVVDTDGVSAAGADCSVALGASKRRSSSGRSCGIAGGAAFITEGQPELAETFACMARVGLTGDNGERPVDALLSALSPSASAEGGCNEGFLREDALLVVTLISDEDDTTSGGDPEDWRDALLSVKGGDEDAVVTLGILGDNNLPDGICGRFDADGAPRLQAFARRQGMIGSVCAREYSEFFGRSVGWIAATCEDFVPPVVR